MDVASKALSCPSHPLHHFTGFIQRIKISFGLTAQHVPAVTPVNVWALFSRFLGNIDMVAIVNVVDIVIGVYIVKGMGMLDIMAWEGRGVKAPRRHKGARAPIIASLMLLDVFGHIS